MLYCNRGGRCESRGIGCGAGGERVGLLGRGFKSPAGGGYEGRGLEEDVKVQEEIVEDEDKIRMWWSWRRSL